MSTKSSQMIGSLRSRNGWTTFLPRRCLYRSSSGWTATAVSPSIVSTRVVATTIVSSVTHEQTACYFLFYFWLFILELHATQRLESGSCRHDSSYASAYIVFFVYSAHSEFIQSSRLQQDGLNSNITFLVSKTKERIKAIIQRNQNYSPAVKCFDHSKYNTTRIFNRVGERDEDSKFYFVLITGYRKKGPSGQFLLVDLLTKS